MSPLGWRAAAGAATPLPLAAGAAYGVLAVGGAQIAAVHFGELHSWTVLGVAVAIACATFAAKPSRSFLPWVGATVGVLVAPLLVDLLSPRPAPIPASARTLDALVGLSQQDPLVAVATGWRPVRSAAVSGSWTVGPRLEPARTYSLVALASTHGPSGPAPTAADERRFTREAFARAWRSVEPDGHFAWLTADEVIFARGVLQIAEILAAETEDAAPFASRAFALRVAESVPSANYRFLLLVSRQPYGVADVRRIAALERTLPVRTLFGPGVGGRGAWSAFAERVDVAHARDVLRRDLSRRAGQWLDLSSASTGRPVFLRVDASPTAPRVMTGVGVVALLALLLLPLPHRRREDSVDAPPWPLPLPLGAFAALGAAPVFAVVALAGQMVALGGRAVVDPIVAIAGALVGFAGGVRFGVSRGVATALPLIGALAALALALSLESLVDGPLSAGSARQLFDAAAAALFAFTAAVCGSRARRELSDAMPDVIPWSIRVQGLAVLVASVSAPWLVQWRGFGGVWTAAAIAYVLGAWAPWLGQVKPRK